MSGKQSTHAKGQENMTHTEENGQSIETNPEVMQMLEWAEKDIEIAFPNRVPYI